MEQFPKPEAGKEKIEKAKVMELLRAKGLEDPEANAAVMQWTAQREEEVMQENTSRAAIVFNVERADLYIAAGDTEGALDCLWDARTQALQENDAEMAALINAKLEAADSNKG